MSNTDRYRGKLFHLAVALEIELHFSTLVRENGKLHCSCSVCMAGIASGRCQD